MVPGAIATKVRPGLVIQSMLLEAKTKREAADREHDRLVNLPKILSDIEANDAEAQRRIAMFDEKLAQIGAAPPEAPTTPKMNIGEGLAMLFNFGNSRGVDASVASALQRQQVSYQNNMAAYQARQDALRTQSAADLQLAQIAIGKAEQGRQRLDAAASQKAAEARDAGQDAFQLQSGVAFRQLEEGMRREAEAREMETFKIKQDLLEDFDKRKEGRDDVRADRRETIAVLMNTLTQVEVDPSQKLKPGEEDQVDKLIKSIRAQGHEIDPATADAFRAIGKRNFAAAQLDRTLKLLPLLDFERRAANDALDNDLRALQDYNSVAKASGGNIPMGVLPGNLPEGTVFVDGPGHVEVGSAIDRPDAGPAEEDVQQLVGGIGALDKARDRLRSIESELRAAEAEGYTDQELMARRDAAKAAVDEQEAKSLAQRQAVIARAEAPLRSWLKARREYALQMIATIGKAEAGTRFDVPGAGVLEVDDSPLESFSVPFVGSLPKPGKTRRQAAQDAMRAYFRQETGFDLDDRALRRLTETGPKGAKGAKK
jgi:hypothetical protein